MKKLLILNGPNLNLLGLREPEIYGERDYAALISFAERVCKEEKVKCSIYQSNHEGALVDCIQEAFGVYDGIVLNPAAYTHTSVAIRDALLAVKIPVVEVHLSDTNSREPFRKVNFVRDVCVGVFEGEGFESYAKAIRFLARL